MLSEQAQNLVEKYQFLNMVIHGNVEGITHEESLMQLPFDTNCMNWVMGHIVTNRSHVLEAVNAAHIWRDDVRNLYHTGTAPIKPESTALQFEKLLAYLDESVELLKAALENVSAERLAENFTNYRGEKTREAHLLGFHWHETYHIGQLEIFKDMALAGRASK
ncbi:MAG: DinB family protein [Anaerolineales bacterium]|nr:DinB family protein [Anaerolineales bacterium]